MITAAQVLQDHMEQFHPISLRASEWNKAASVVIDAHDFKLSKRITLLEDMLIKAHNTFMSYAALHQIKNTEDSRMKANANLAIARQILHTIMESSDYAK